MKYVFTYVYMFLTTCSSTHDTFTRVASITDIMGMLAITSVEWSTKGIIYGKSTMRIATANIYSDVE